MKNKLLFILLFILCIVTIGSVSAVGTDMGQDLSTSINNDSNYNINLESDHSFSELQNQIDNANENDIIEINGRYYFDGTPISINKSINIKGLENGVIFDGCNSSGVFKIYSSKTSLYNMIFTNCNFESSIYWYGSEGVLDNCSFSPNSFGSITWYGNEGTLSSCYFEVNPAFDVNPIVWYGDDPIFINNSLSNDYGAELAECCSAILHINSTDEIIGFRRDSTEKSNIIITTTTLGNLYSLKQYRDVNNFVHVLITSNGWLIGSGGRSGHGISGSILNLVKSMVESNSISKTKLSQIGKLLPQFAHLVIKAPDGRFGVAYHSSCFTGVLKEGEYISVPNDITYYRRGYYDNSTNNTVENNTNNTVENSTVENNTNNTVENSTENITYSDVDVIKAAIMVLATDKYGVARRNIMTYHYQSINGTNKVSAYVSNDPGKFVGKSTSKYADDVYFRGKYISSSSIPIALNKKEMGVFTFPKQVMGKINTSSLSAYYKNGKTLEIKLVDLEGNPLKNKKLTVRVYTTTKNYKDYSVTTNDEGIAKFNTNNLQVGTFNVEIFSPSKTVIASKVKITIKISKRPTNVTAPIVTNKYKMNNYFKITVVDKLNNLNIKNLVLKLKVYTGKSYKVYSINTNDKGIAYLNTKYLSRGIHNVIITTSSKNYYVNVNSTILIK